MFAAIYFSDLKIVVNFTESDESLSNINEFTVLISLS